MTRDIITRKGYDEGTILSFIDTSYTQRKLNIAFKIYLSLY